MSKHQVELELLVLAAQAGNEDAFRLLFQRLHKGLLSFAVKLCGQPEIAADAVQEAWLEVSKDLCKLQDPNAFRSWLFKKVRWRLSDALQKQQKQAADSWDEGFQATQADQASDSENEGRLTQCLKKMPPVEQEMMHLFYVEGLKIREIAAILNLPQGTIKSG